MSKKERIFATSPPVESVLAMQESCIASALQHCRAGQPIEIAILENRYCLLDIGYKPRTVGPARNSDMEVRRSDWHLWPSAIELSGTSFRPAYEPSLRLHRKHCLLGGRNHNHPRPVWRDPWLSFYCVRIDPQADPDRRRESRDRKARFYGMNNGSRARSDLSIVALMLSPGRDRTTQWWSQLSTESKSSLMSAINSASLGFGCLVNHYTAKEMSLASTAHPSLPERHSSTAA
ncbi:hypothetical protein BS47DRAFT_1389726 [Hydnum rufescens UP504]|uniref:Uncharacterized protein n=1 Tax=Hydnum rufescens UP504 TaxID=1448309 RepID=A0A9P6E064_9AGAM|nr:hypothetical protein BS47DRAFT_1389726 [Hydnum rufescens UP504]